MNREDAFTGLEAAIVLIAFVVVAAVFSYVVLGAGFFTTQESQRVVHTGVSQATSNMEILGDVYGLDTNGNGEMDTVRFTVGLAAGGAPIDMTKVQMVWSTASTVETIANVTNLTGDPAEGGKWNISEQNFGDTDLLLESGEQFTVYVMPTAELGTSTKFSLEVRPSIGAALGLTRTTPAQIDAVNKLY